MTDSIAAAQLRSYVDQIDPFDVRVDRFVRPLTPFCDARGYLDPIPAQSHLIRGAEAAQ